MAVASSPGGDGDPGHDLLAQQDGQAAGQIEARISPVAGVGGHRGGRAQRGAGLQGADETAVAEGHGQHPYRPIAAQYPGVLRDAWIHGGDGAVLLMGGPEGDHGMG